VEPADLLRELTAGLDAAGIPHMIVGSFASTSYGEPRSTQDIDVVIDPDPASLRTWLAGLDRHRWYVGDAETALAHRDQFNVIDLTSGWKIDLVICKDRPFSHSELARRRTRPVAGTSVPVAAAEDVVLSKLEWGAASGSERQIADAVSVLVAVGDDLDFEYLRRWADELGVQDPLEDALGAAGLTDDS